MRIAWPYLTDGIPPVPGVIKRRPEDFRVEEVPDYPPCGSGDHVVALIEKTGMTTRRAVLALARALGVPPGRVGAAGHKDARAVTRQLLSIEGVEPSRVLTLDLPGIRVLDVARHRSKLRPGALRGNRFTIRLREVPASGAAEAQRVLDALARRGVPNYFGPQRFGMRGDTWKVGRLLLSGEFAAAAACVIADPAAGDPDPIRRARELAVSGDYRAAASAWPDGFADCARLCREMHASGGNARASVLRLGRSVLGFYVSAYQGWLFNRVLAERVPSVDRLLPGDIAWSHATGRCAPIADPARESARAACLEISPTGPMAGPAMERPTLDAGRIETRVLAEAGCDPDALPRTGALACIGARRPLRFPLEQVRLEPGTDEAGRYLELRFTLPPGCYATVVLREICKDGLREGARDAEEFDGAIDPN